MALSRATETECLRKEFPIVIDLGTQESVFGHPFGEARWTRLVGALIDARGSSCLAGGIGTIAKNASA
jgi:hypothetical protein